MEDGKNIIKDQEIKEASGILETLNNTKNIEKDSETGPVVDAESITNKTNVTEEAAATESEVRVPKIIKSSVNENVSSPNDTVIETKDSTSVVSSPSDGIPTVNGGDAEPVVVVPAMSKKKAAALTPK
jgi:hypothetical protein